MYAVGYFLEVGIGISFDMRVCVYAPHFGGNHSLTLGSHHSTGQCLGSNGCFFISVTLLYSHSGTFVLVHPALIDVSSSRARRAITCSGQPECFLHNVVYHLNCLRPLSVTMASKVCSHGPSTFRTEYRPRENVVREKKPAL